jgi:hypothetical protein
MVKVLLLMGLDRMILEKIQKTSEAQYFRTPPLPKAIYKDYNPSAPW